MITDIDCTVARWLKHEFRQHRSELLCEVFIQESRFVRRRLRRAGAELVVDESPVDPVKPEWVVQRTWRALLQSGASPHL